MCTSLLNGWHAVLGSEHGYKIETSNKNTFEHRARWHIGMSSALCAADPGSNLGVGDGTTKKIDRSLTCDWFGLQMCRIQK